MSGRWTCAVRYVPVAPERRALALIGDAMGLLDLEGLCHGLGHRRRSRLRRQPCAVDRFYVYGAPLR
jgi:hypothetical protein